MLQRLGKARSARAGDPAGTAGPEADESAEVASLTGLGAANGAPPDGQPDGSGGAGPAGEGGRPRQGGPPGEGGRPGAAGRPRPTGRTREAANAPAPAPRATQTVELPADFDLAAHDPLRAFLLSQAGAVDITRLELASPALAALKRPGSCSSYRSSRPVS